MFRTFLKDQFIYTYIHVLYAMPYDTRLCDLYIQKYASMLYV